MATDDRGATGTAYTLLDTGNINTRSLTGAADEKYPVSKINTTTLAANNDDNVNYLLWGSYADD
jgi:hypothetical protein